MQQSQAPSLDISTIVDQSFEVVKTIRRAGDRIWAGIVERDGQQFFLKVNLHQEKWVEPYVQLTRFLQANTSVPVPDIVEYGEHYILFEVVDGEALETVQLTPAIRRQLQGYVEDMRRFTFDMVGSIDERGNITNIHDYAITNRPLPSVNVRTFQKYRIGPLKYRFVANPHIRRYRNIVDLVCDMAPTESHSVLCHTDLNVDNVLVRGDQVVAITDWEGCGVYPFSYAVGKAEFLNPIFFPTTLYNELGYKNPTESARFEMLWFICRYINDRDIPDKVFFERMEEFRARFNI
ncbi:hypothetical protein EV182_002996 [Spiromyces aspiralis]|uniref:Uncharacterized protein n=1 Tax=Spiromyces aspiralis TaxID=68401 RepID=A0ACC1HR94_9FUNG|nr:hypothetical protein EV182_002996 [Spiromyces aspiralis]